MTINSYKVGPGTLTIGSGPLNVSAQVTACQVVPSESVETEDDINVLSGEVLEGEDVASISYVLSGTFLQDLAAAGVVDYTWQNAGDEVAFNFEPLTTADRSIEGTVRLVPLSIGGTAKTRATSDFEWAIIGTPTFGDATP
jgi:hypothetical protein